MTEWMIVQEGQFMKVPFEGDCQKGQNLKLPTQPAQTQPAQAPVQPVQPQTGGTTNDRK
jgi:hypothetical protein